MKAGPIKSFSLSETLLFVPMRVMSSPYSTFFDLDWALLNSALVYTFFECELFHESNTIRQDSLEENRDCLQLVASRRSY